jgi:hypothetical protein
MDLAGFRGWLDAYFRAWESNEPADVAALFSEDAEYRVGPFAEAWVGRDEIVRRWTSGAQTDVTWSCEPLALEEGVGIAHWNVVARDPDDVLRERDGILVLAFTDDGRCRDHGEWYLSRDVPG